MNGKQKLELTWIGKDKDIKLEPRILIEDPSKSYGDENSKNMLIHGDNLLALKALEQDFAGKIKCIYIDPPYNTGNAFEHYDDGIEHSIWLSLIRPRLEILKNLLRDDGVIFVQIDDNEACYLKVLMDEIFGRSNYETTLYIKVRHENRILREDIRYQLVMEQVLCYRKSPLYSPNRRAKQRVASDDYIYQIELIKEPIETISINGYNVEVYKQEDYKLVKLQPGEGLLKQYQIRGSLITQKGSASEYYEKFLRARRETDGLGTLYKVIGMGEKGDGLGYRFIMQPTKNDSKNGFYFQGKPLKEMQDKGLPYQNFYDFVDLFNNVGYEGGVEFKNGKKPEEYIKFFFELSNTQKGDWVLDSFLGSGSTVSTAQKIGLNWIGIELGDHANTHCLPRLKSVIDGTDQSGISKAGSCQSGGGFKFYELAPSLLKKDHFGKWVIDEQYNANMLAAAMCKHEGFKLLPDEQFYWKQGISTETDYIFTTTAFVTTEQLDKIKDEMKEGESLLICAKAFAPECLSRHVDITVKKIPQMILGKCEFGQDNYDLNIVKVTEEEVEEEFGGEDE